MKHPLHYASDRAVLAYLERVCGVNVCALRHRIGRNVDLADDHPDASAVIHNGFRYRIEGRTIVDVVKSKSTSFSARKTKS